MAYGYARRTAAAALYIQGLVDKGLYEHVKGVFIGLQIKAKDMVEKIFSTPDSKTFIEFQDQAAAESVKFMAVYNQTITMLTVRAIVGIAEGVEIPSGTLVGDDELLRRIETVIAQT